MEGLSGKAGWHFHSPAGGPGATSPADFTGWHTYGALWEPGSVTYYYDGVEVGKIASGITSSPMYLILNNGISDSIGGPTHVGSEMLVDYVHVYSHAPMPSRWPPRRTTADQETWRTAAARRLLNRRPPG
jgi:beta-glucanase (GH16 family)